MPSSLKMWWLQALEQPKKLLSLSPSCAPPPEKEQKPLLKEIWRKRETLYCLDLDGKPARKPFKPFITQPRRRFKGGYDKRNFACGRCFTTNLMADPSLQIIVGSSRKRTLQTSKTSEKFDRSPTMK